MAAATCRDSEVATRVKEQLEELGDLEGQVARAREDAKNILEKLKRSEADEAENLQQEMGREKTYPGLFLPLLNQRAKSQNYRQNSKLHKI